VCEPPLTAEPPPALQGLFHPPDPAAVAGQDLWLVHPWSLADAPPGMQAVAVLDSTWHSRWRWSPARWHVVLTRMAALAPVRWLAPADTLAAALGAARRVRGRANPHLAPALARVCTEPDLPPWPEPAAACRSFSAYWSRVLKASRPAAPGAAGDLLHKK
jgi:deoxyribodipyrimidine photo-lyase